jgi:redox-sensitive bicupin YhaK (pirin superfamily)
MTMQIGKIVKAMEITEGAGVTVHRTIGTPALKNLDPFLLLDHFSSDDPGEYIAGFPDHPHRGFITFTYMLDGHMLHQDSMGNRGELRPGGIQWMKAASGVIHSEMPQQDNGLMRGFQLWINLPAAEKMSDPAYQEFAAEKIPAVDAQGVTVKVLCGEYRGARGPVVDPHTGVNYIDVGLAPGRSFAISPAAGMHTLMYLFEGSLNADGAPVTQHAALIPVPGSEIAVTAGDTGARFILVSGKPLNEPVVQYGPFVMNTQDEIHQAFEDYRAGRLVRSRASVTV